MSILWEHITLHAELTRYHYGKLYAATYAQPPNIERPNSVKVSCVALEVKVQHHQIGNQLTDVVSHLTHLVSPPRGCLSCIGCTFNPHDSTTAIVLYGAEDSVDNSVSVMTLSTYLQKVVQFLGNEAQGGDKNTPALLFGLQIAARVGLGLQQLHECQFSHKSLTLDTVIVWGDPFGVEAVSADNRKKEKPPQHRGGNLSLLGFQLPSSVVVWGHKEPIVTSNGTTPTSSLFEEFGGDFDLQSSATSTPLQTPSVVSSAASAVLHPIVMAMISRSHETQSCGQCTEYSDVYAMGILLWQLFVILGDEDMRLPLAHLYDTLVKRESQSEKLRLERQLQAGTLDESNNPLHILPKPRICPSSIWSTLIKKCWALDPTHRPRADILACLLHESAVLLKNVNYVKTNRMNSTGFLAQFYLTPSRVRSDLTVFLEEIVSGEISTEYIDIESLVAMLENEANSRMVDEKMEMMDTIEGAFTTRNASDILSMPNAAQEKRMMSDFFQFGMWRNDKKNQGAKMTTATHPFFNADPSLTRGVQHQATLMLDHQSGLIDAMKGELSAVLENRGNRLDDSIQRQAAVTIQRHVRGWLVMLHMRKQREAVQCSAAVQIQKIVRAKQARVDVERIKRDIEIQKELFRQQEALAQEEAERLEREKQQQMARKQSMRKKSVFDVRNTDRKKSIWNRNVGAQSPGAGVTKPQQDPQVRRQSIAANYNSRASSRSFKPQNTPEDEHDMFNNTMSSTKSGKSSNSGIRPSTPNLVVKRKGGVVRPKVAEALDQPTYAGRRKSVVNFAGLAEQEEHQDTLDEQHQDLLEVSTTSIRSKYSLLSTSTKRTLNDETTDTKSKRKISIQLSPDMQERIEKRRATLELEESTHTGLRKPLLSNPTIQYEDHTDRGYTPDRWDKTLDEGKQGIESTQQSKGDDAEVPEFMQGMSGMSPEMFGIFEGNEKPTPNYDDFFDSTDDDHEEFPTAGQRGAHFEEGEMEHDEIPVQTEIHEDDALHSLLQGSHIDEKDTAPDSTGDIDDEVNEEDTPDDSSSVLGESPCPPRRTSGEEDMFVPEETDGKPTIVQPNNDENEYFPDIANPDIKGTIDEELFGADSDSDDNSEFDDNSDGVGEPEAEGPLVVLTEANLDDTAFGTSPSVMLGESRGKYIRTPESRPRTHESRHTKSRHSSLCTPPRSVLSDVPTTPDGERPDSRMMERLELDEGEIKSLAQTSSNLNCNLEESSNLNINDIHVNCEDVVDEAGSSVKLLPTEIELKTTNRHETSVNPLSTTECIALEEQARRTLQQARSAVVSCLRIEVAESKGRIRICTQQNHKYGRLLVGGASMLSACRDVNAAVKQAQKALWADQCKHRKWIWREHEIRWDNLKVHWKGWRETALNHHKQRSTLQTRCCKQKDKMSGDEEWYRYLKTDWFYKHYNVYKCVHDERLDRKAIMAYQTDERLTIQDIHEIAFNEAVDLEDCFEQLREIMRDEMDEWDMLEYDHLEVLFHWEMGKTTVLKCADVEYQESLGRQKELILEKHMWHWLVIHAKAEYRELWGHSLQVHPIRKLKIRRILSKQSREVVRKERKRLNKMQKERELSGTQQSKTLPAIQHAHPLYGRVGVSHRETLCKENGIPLCACCGTVIKDNQTGYATTWPELASTHCYTQSRRAIQSLSEKVYPTAPVKQLTKEQQDDLADRLSHYHNRHEDIARIAAEIYPPPTVKKLSAVDATNFLARLEDGITNKEDNLRKMDEKHTWSLSPSKTITNKQVKALSNRLSIPKKHKTGDGLLGN